MPEKTCGRKYCSPRFKLVEASLAPGKSRTGNHLRPLQIHTQNKTNMLHMPFPIFSVPVEASRPSGSVTTVHASEFIPGFVTFVGN